MSENRITKSVVIEGNRDHFASKAAIDRFKNDLKCDNKEKLAEGNYFKSGWTYEMVSDSGNEIKVKLVEKKKEPKQMTEEDAKRYMLKMKLRDMQQKRMSPQQVVNSMKDKVPEDVIGAYMDLKRNPNFKMPIPHPLEVMSKVEEYRPVIPETVQSFGMFKGTNNPFVNYFRLLAKHLGLPTNFIPPQQPQMQQPNPYLDDLRKQREAETINEVDDEMKKIYESLGIDVPADAKKPKEEEIDDEMKKIYESLGIQVEQETKSMNM